jgi:hypothetical protein
VFRGLDTVFDTDQSGQAMYGPIGRFQEILRTKFALMSVPAFGLDTTARLGLALQTDHALAGKLQAERGREASNSATYYDDILAHDGK